jgi:hypothetical protein
MMDSVERIEQQMLIEHEHGELDVETWLKRYPQHRDELAEFASYLEESTPVVAIPRLISWKDDHGIAERRLREVLGRMVEGQSSVGVAGSISRRARGRWLSTRKLSRLLPAAAVTAAAATILLFLIPTLQHSSTESPPRLSEAEMTPAITLPESSGRPALIFDEGSWADATAGAWEVENVLLPAVLPHWQAIHMGTQSLLMANEVLPATWLVLRFLAEDAAGDAPEVALEELAGALEGAGFRRVDSTQVTRLAGDSGNVPVPVIPPFLAEARLAHSDGRLQVAYWSGLLLPSGQEGVLLSHNQIEVAADQEGARTELATRLAAELTALVREVSADSVRNTVWQRLLRSR